MSKLPFELKLHIVEQYIHINDVLNYIIKTVDKELYIYLKPIFEIVAERQQVYSNNPTQLFINACESGKLFPCKWIQRVYNIKDIYINKIVGPITCFDRKTVKYPTCLFIAAEKGHLDVVKWLYSNFSIIDDKINKNIVYTAVKFGHLELSIWLYDNLKIKNYDNTNKLMLRLTVVKNRLDILKQLHKKLNFTKSFIINTYILSLANEYQRYIFTNYIITTWNLSEDTINNQFYNPCCTI